VQHDLSDSAFEFQRAVWPVIQCKCGGGELIPVEAVANTDFGRDLDVLAGIDAWQIKRGTGMRGIASRVQWDDAREQYPYCTFTVRKTRFSNGNPRLSRSADIEFEKRWRASRGESGWLFPHLTVQAFFSQPRRAGDLLTCGLAKTMDVVDMIVRGRCTERCTSNASFWVVPWVEMRNDGYPIWTWPRCAAVTPPVNNHHKYRAQSLFERP
jgi:hypothetical protein